MDKIKEYLIDWTEQFVKNKDVFLKSIVSIEKGKDCCDIYVKHKNRECCFIVEPFIKDLSVLEKLKMLSKDRWTSMVLANNIDNLKSVIKNWKELVELGSKFSVYFVNPFSMLDKKWIIFPHTHHTISDPASLEKGLKSMFDTVDNIDEKEFLNKIKDDKN